MRDLPASTIAQVLFGPNTSLNFAHVVGELDRSLDGYRGGEHSLRWDCDDLAVFQLRGTRIIMAFNELSGKGFSGCLTVSVGAASASAPQSSAVTPMERRHDLLCRQIADRVQSYYSADAVLWHEMPSPVTAEIVDNLIDTLPGRDDLCESPLRPAPDHPAEAADHPAKAKAKARVTPLHPARPAAPVEATNDQPDLPLTDLDRLHRLRTALYEVDAEVAAAQRPSTQMRLAVHTMNSTLIIVSLPLGAALLTYSLLRGENVALSARCMAITGTVLAIAQTPFGQQLANMI